MPPIATREPEAEEVTALALHSIWTILTIRLLFPSHRRTVWSSHTVMNLLLFRFPSKIGESPQHSDFDPKCPCTKSNMSLVTRSISKISAPFVPTMTLLSLQANADIWGSTEVGVDTFISHDQVFFNWLPSQIWINPSFPPEINWLLLLLLPPPATIREDSLALVFVEEEDALFDESPMMHRADIAPLCAFFTYLELVLSFHKSSVPVDIPVTTSAVAGR